MLFRPLRLLIIIGAAFIAGIIYEKQKYKEMCGEIGGTLTESICQIQISLIVLSNIRSKEFYTWQNSFA